MPSRAHSYAARAPTLSPFVAGCAFLWWVPIELNELVRVQRGIIALNAYAMGGANAKREQSFTKNTPAGHTSGELELKP